MTRAFNFCAGPAVLPEEVLAWARNDLLDWQGRGLSVMEMSHRSDEFMGIAHQAEQDLRQLLAIPANYRVLFMQGGASSQFATVPLNLLSEGGHADYVDTGIWSQKGIAEGRRFGDVAEVASARDNGYTAVPDPDQWVLRPGADYLHITPNETIGGLAYPAIPDLGDCPLVADLSSAILSEPLDVSRFGLIYAGAQKNIGPAGLTLVIIREDLIKPMSDCTPAMMSYAIADKNGSMYNTPPTYAWYLAGLVFQWLKQHGGLQAMATLNQRKAGKLYGAIDNSDFYNNPIRPDCRSLMNVPFTLADESLNKAFLAGAEERRLLNLNGHRSVGGMRASIYNAMPEAGVDALIDYMADFEKERA
ncbi:MAG: 3-phosphoserine/phosphohydroxythreonine transaminase [Halomonadaceae bacterium]|nr:MAG: 3-phosphoserine/phosphohydroxythreonine transaminase [Halomonadaceae bacterium]